MTAIEPERLIAHVELDSQADLWTALPLSHVVAGLDPGQSPDVWVRVSAGTRGSYLLPVHTALLDTEGSLVLEVGADYETGCTAAGIQPVLADAVEHLNQAVLAAGDGRTTP